MVSGMEGFLLGFGGLFGELLIFFRCTSVLLSCCVMS